MGFEAEAVGLLASTDCALLCYEDGTDKGESYLGFVSVGTVNTISSVVYVFAVKRI